MIEISKGNETIRVTKGAAKIHEKTGWKAKEPSKEPAKEPAKINTSKK